MHWYQCLLSLILPVNIVLCMKLFLCYKGEWGLNLFQIFIFFGPAKVSFLYSIHTQRLIFQLVIALIHADKLNSLQAKTPKSWLSMSHSYWFTRIWPDSKNYNSLTFFSSPNRMLKIKTKGTFNCVRDIGVRMNCL